MGYQNQKKEFNHIKTAVILTVFAIILLSFMLEPMAEEAKENFAVESITQSDIITKTVSEYEDEVKGLLEAKYPDCEFSVELDTYTNGDIKVVGSKILGSAFNDKARKGSIKEELIRFSYNLDDLTFTDNYFVAYTGDKLRSQMEEDTDTNIIIKVGTDSILPEDKDGLFGKDMNDWKKYASYSIEEVAGRFIVTVGIRPENEIEEISKEGRDCYIEAVNKVISYSAEESDIVSETDEALDSKDIDSV